MERAYSSERQGAERSGPANTPVPAPRLGLRAGLFQGSGWTAFRLVVDAGLLALGNAAALYGAPAANADSSARDLVWLLPPLVIALLAASRMYRDTIQVRIIDGLGQVIAATSLAAISLIAAAALVDPGAAAGPVLARAWLFGTLYLAGGRILLGWAQRNARQTGLIAKPTLIVGAGLIGAHVERRLTSQPELGLRPVGYLDADPPPAEMVPDRHAPVLGGPDDLRRVAAQTRAAHVVLALQHRPRPPLIPLVRRCELLGLEVSLVPRLFERVNDRARLEHLGGLPLFGLRPIDPKGWQFAIKHALDRIAPLGLMLVLSPLLARWRSPSGSARRGPVLFRQRRRRPRRPRVRHAQVPLDDRRAGAPERCPTCRPARRLGARRRRGPGPPHARRARCCAARRSTSCRSSSTSCMGEMSLVGPRPERPEFVDAVRARLRALHRPPPRQVGHHRLGAGPRPARADLAGRPRRVGQLLHRELVAGARPEDPR